MFRVRRPFTADAPEFVAHPVIHVEDEIKNRVREAQHPPCGDLQGNVFDAHERIDMGSFSAEQFDQDWSHGSDLTRQTGGDDDRCGDSRGASILPPTFDRGRGEASGTPEGFWRSDSEDCLTRRRHDRSRRAASHRSADPVPGRYGILLANAAGPTGTPTSTVCWDRESPAPPRSLTPCRAGTRRSDGKSSDEPTSFPSDGRCRDRRAASGRGSLPYPADGGESSWHCTGIISGTRGSVSVWARPEFASGACKEVCPLPVFARRTVEAAVPEERGVRRRLATAARAWGHFAISEPPLPGGCRAFGPHKTRPSGWDDGTEAAQLGYRLAKYVCSKMRRWCSS